MVKIIIDVSYDPRNKRREKYESIWALESTCLLGVFSFVRDLHSKYENVCTFFIG